MYIIYSCKLQIQLKNLKFFSLLSVKILFKVTDDTFYFNLSIYCMIIIGLIHLRSNTTCINVVYSIAFGDGFSQELMHISLLAEPYDGWCQKRSV